MWVIIFDPKDFSHFTGLHIHDVFIDLVNFSLRGPGVLDSFYDILNIISTFCVWHKIIWDIIIDFKLGR